jgi:hypothetical protein
MKRAASKEDFLQRADRVASHCVLPGGLDSGQVADELMVECRRECLPLTRACVDMPLVQTARMAVHGGRGQWAIRLPSDEGGELTEDELSEGAQSDEDREEDAALLARLGAYCQRTKDNLRHTQCLVN